MAKNNIYKINVVDSIPEDLEVGTILINMGKHSSEISDEDLINEPRFLVHGPERNDYMYLGNGVNKDVIWDVSSDYRIDNNRIIITPRHPGFSIPEPNKENFYLDSKFNKLYAPVENPRVDGYRHLSYLKEQEIIYQDSATQPVVFVGADYSETPEIEHVQIFYEDLDMDEESADEYSRYLPSNVITVHSEEELHALTPSFLGIYKVKHDNGTFTPYIYNPYTEVIETYYICNVDVLY